MPRFGIKCPDLGFCDLDLIHATLEGTTRSHGFWIYRGNPRTDTPAILVQKSLCISLIGLCQLVSLSASGANDLQYYQPRQNSSRNLAGYFSIEGG